MEWVTPIKARNQTAEDLLRFIMEEFGLTESELDQRFTDWRMAPEEMERVLEALEG